ncbi:MAG TPA: hypothetical protein VFI23_17705 [Rhizomicrobium sp.]|nr:hypothetical protein [Rhizomicrobium sp.]
MRKLTPLILLCCVLLAGCWQTVTRPYRNVMSLQPFAQGPITAKDPSGKETHYVLHKVARGRYHMTQTDRGQDFGQGFELGFFPLPGAPSNVLIYQAAALERTRRDDNLRYYGLVVVTMPYGAQEIRPDCEKDARAAAVSHTRMGKDGACTFASRAALEASLLALWKSGKKPEYSYTLH